LTLLWALLATLAGAAGVRYLFRLRSGGPTSGTPRVDDEAIRRILETGSLPSGRDEPLDMEEAARAEEEFWSESWDEPEEYHR
jgi:hypothetical protein